LPAWGGPLLEVASNEWLGGAGPPDLYSPILSKAITEIQIDEALVRNTSFICHALEIRNDFF
jgi:hypothetical protein